MAAGEADTLGNENTPGKRNATEAIAVYRQIGRRKRVGVAEAMLAEL